MSDSSDFKGIDRLLNGEFNKVNGFLFQDSPLAPFCLIVAWLSRNPDFDVLAIKLRETSRGGANEAAIKGDEWQKLVKYLREEVQPIV